MKEVVRKTILLVEDEETLRTPMQRLLQREGFDCITACSCAEARKLLGDDVDAVLLDWLLPDGQGIELLRSWRQAGLTMPVLLVTARDELIDKILGLEFGADDYLTKPFEPRELIARLRARLRKWSERDDDHRRLNFAGLSIDLEARTASYDGRILSLARLEFDLLALFMQRPEQVIRREEILEEVWGMDRFPTTRTVDNHVMWLRQKTSGHLFATIRGVGYRLTKP